MTFTFLLFHGLKKNANFEFGNEILFAIKMYLYFALIKTNTLLNNCRRCNIGIGLYTCTNVCPWLILYSSIFSFYIDLTTLQHVYLQFMAGKLL